MIQELDDFYSIATNEFQTPINKKLLLSLPEEVAEQLIDFIDSVEYIKILIDPNRKRAKDLPRDKDGKIIVDLSHPHILENMDYFRPSALHYQEHGCYTFLRVNTNPNSECIERTGISIIALTWLHWSLVQIENDGKTRHKEQEEYHPELTDSYWLLDLSAIIIFSAMHLIGLP